MESRREMAAFTSNFDSINALITSDVISLSSFLDHALVGNALFLKIF
jgi:hypothetical protein